MMQNYFFLLFLGIVILLLTSICSSVLWIQVPFVVIIYLAASTPYFASYTLKQAEQRGHAVAKDILILFALAGLLTAIIYTCLPYVYRTAKPVSIPEAVKQVLQGYLFRVFPASRYWTHLGDDADVPKIVFIHGISIIMNVLLYIQYGCVFYFLIKLFSKNKART